jgi:predicted Fe-Mo cluster-binding NifX family protein
MRIAIPVWQGRVSPVFDVAKTIRVTDIDTNGGEPSESEMHTINSAHPGTTLTDLEVDLLVCSAISAPLEAILWVSGIEVISDICGSPDEIIRAIAAGDNELGRFRSPGSRGRSKRSPVGRGFEISRGSEPPR